LRPIELIRTAGLCAIACLAAAAAAVAGAGTSPAEALRACVAKLQPPARGLDALAARCPDLKGALTELGYPQTLSPGWEDRLTPGQLEDLAALASRYRGDRPSTAPDLGAVRGIVAGLASERASPKSWWEVIKDWVRSLFAGHDQHELSWIERWVNKLSGVAGFLAVVTYILVALVIVGSFVYIVLELRVSGAFGRTPHGSVGAKTADDARCANEALAQEDLARAPLLDQPALLLALLVQSLRRGGRLSAERHLTHRELARAAALDDADQHGRLGRLTQVAEELLYGARPPAVELVHSAVEDGRELLRQLEGPRPVPS
jgi:hypothetical protein